MNRWLIFFILLYISNARAIAQDMVQKEIKTLNFEQLEPYLHKQNDTLYFINFWATWCIPCRKELPAIQQVGEKYKDKKFKILLVSLDFPDKLESGLRPFVKAKQIKEEVILLDDPHQHIWIDKVDKNWGGEIPYSLIYGKSFREGYAQSFQYNELDSIINVKLNQP